MFRLALAAGLVALLGPLGACAQASSPGEEILVMEVAPNAAPCLGEARQRCLLVRQGPGDPWRFFYDAIEGFTHEPGFLYRLEVSRRRTMEAIADASAFRYRLVEILSREPAEDVAPPP